MANALTIARIVLIPVFLYLVLAEPVPGSMLWAVGVLLLSGLTDVADGYVARRRQEISTLGALLDPLADKLTLVAALLAMAWKGWVPLWLGGLLLAKEGLQVLGAAWLVGRRGRAVTARWPGKVSTGVLYAGATGVLLGWRPAVVLVGLGVILSLLAGVYYAALALGAESDTPSGPA